jgi:hypothetical protein
MSVYTYFLPVLVVALFIYSYVARKRGMAASQHATVGALAQRLGLNVLEGDTKINLYYLSQPNRNYRRNIRLEGAPYGRRLRFDFTDGHRTQDFLVAVKVTTTWGCFLVAEVAVPFPEFELTLRSPNQYLVPETIMTHLLEAPTGDPRLDAAYRVAIADPRWASALIPALQALSGQVYVHVVGQGNTVMISFSRVGLAYFANAAEQYSHALEVLACSLEGKQPPAALPALGQHFVPQNVQSYAG